MAMLSEGRSAPLAPFLVALGLLLLAAFPAPAEPREPPDEDVEPPAMVRPRHLRPGTPAAEVLRRLGKPPYVARQILYGRYVEQWTYDAPEPVRITFDWRKGQEKQILTVQPLSTPGR
jgi:hypothetical protein